MTEHADPRAPRLLHVTTVPMSLLFLRGQAAFMRRVGLESMAVSSPGEELELFGREEIVPVHAVQMPRRIAVAADLVAVTRLWQLLRRERPAIVHAHTPKAGLLGMIAATLAGVPARVYHIHGLPFMTASSGRRALLRTTEGIACALAHRVLCVSPSIREVAVQAGLCPADKIAVLGGGSINGVDAKGRFVPDVDGRRRTDVRARLGIPSDATVLGYVGRIVRDKGVTELVEAWQGLREADPGLHLIVVGPFEPQDPVTSEVERVLRSDPRIHLVGLDWDTPKFYEAMDVVVLPSYREGLPVVPLEAAAMAKPVVATDIPGCRDAVADGETGVLVPPRDAGALRRALETFIREPRTAREYGRRGRERVLRDFAQETIWAALGDEYDRLLGRARAALPGDADSEALALAETQ